MLNMLLINATQDAMFGLADLPESVLQSISKHLGSIHDVLGIATTCKTLNKVFTNRLYELDAELTDGAAILRAFTHGPIEAIRRIISLELDVFNTAHLTAAATVNDLEIFKSILQISGNVRHQIRSPPPLSQRKARTPLLAAIENGNLEMIRLLLENGASPNEQLRDKNATCLSVAVKHGRHEAFQMLLDAGASLKSNYGSGSALTTSIEEPFGLDSPNGTLLHSAASAEVTKLLLKNGFPVDGRNSDGDTPLMAASKRNIITVVTALMDAGADVNAVNTRGADAMALAVLSGSREIVQILAKAGVSVERCASSSSQDTRLKIAIAQNNANVVAILLQAGADVYSMAESLRPLDQAAISSLKCLKVMIDHGADLDRKRPDGNCTIHLVAKSCQEQSIKITPALELLSSAKADLSARDAEGNTILHLIHDPEMLRQIVRLDLRISLSSRNNAGLTPLMIACREKRVRCINVLLEYGAADADGTEDADPGARTAFRMALMGDADVNVVMALIKGAINPDNHQDFVSERSKKIVQECVDRLNRGELVYRRVDEYYINRVPLTECLLALRD